MMKEINCNIIRDILPLYVDEVVSEDTKELVSEHLEGCPGCRQELEQLRKPVAIPVERETGPLKRFKKKWKQARFRTALISIFCTVVILAALAAGALWYTRPIALEDLYPGLDLSACDEIRILRAVYQTSSSSRDAEEYQFTISPEDTDFSLMLSQFQNRTFRRSLLNLLPRGTWIHNTQEGDFEWELTLCFDEPLILPDGNGVSGALIHLSDFYGKLELSHNGTTWRCTTTDMDQWLSDVMDIIMAHES